MGTMICFAQAGFYFNYRVAGIALHGDKLLLQRGEGETFWICPGGRAEMGESAEQTLRREMWEELAVEVEVVRLLWFVENFFTYEGTRYHEIALYFLMRLPAESKYLTQPGPFRVAADQTTLNFEWFPREPEVLANLPLLPSFLRTAVRDLPASMQHVVHYDD